MHDGHDKAPWPLRGRQRKSAGFSLPADIDFNLHLNNARYMMLADLAHDPENRNRFSERIMRQIKCYCVLGASNSTLARSVQPRPPTEAERGFMSSDQGLRSLAKAV